jgi:hypothetical protein
VEYSRAEGVATKTARWILARHREEKPQPKNFPRRNPTAVLLPLIDTYGASGRVNYSNDPRFRPILAQLNTLLNDILLIAPNINMLVHEQLTFVERLKKDS